MRTTYVTDDPKFIHCRIWYCKKPLHLPLLSIANACVSLSMSYLASLALRPRHATMLTKHRSKSPRRDAVGRPLASRSSTRPTTGSARISCLRRRRCHATTRYHHSHTTEAVNVFSSLKHKCVSWWFRLRCCVMD